MAACHAAAAALHTPTCLRRAWAPLPAEAPRGPCRARPSTPGSRCHARRRAAVVAAGKQGGGVLDRPTTSPGQDVKKVRQKQKPRNYKVMLHNDSVNRREYVVRVLLKVIKELTVDDAVGAMQQAHLYGQACVLTCPQEDAERYCEGLRANGLVSSIEPAGSGGGSGGEPST